MLCFAVLCVVAVAPAISLSSENQVRYLRYAEVADTIRLFAGSGLPGSEIGDEAAWDAWIRDQDKQVRARIDRGAEDSISNLILYGTSYTKLLRLESTDKALGATGEVSREARVRVHALAAALDTASPGERVRFVREFLNRKGIAKEGREQFLAANLKRFAEEQRGYQQKLEEAGKAPDPVEVLLTRGTLYQTRGLSVDTSRSRRACL